MTDVPSDEPDGIPDPFKALGDNPMLRAMMQALSNQGPLNWEIARQLAVLGATGDRTDPQPEPRERYELNDLARVAAMRIDEVLGGGPVALVECLPVSREAWATRTLTDFRPLFTDLATSLGRTPAVDPVDADPLSAMLGQLTGMMAPSMIGMAIGAMVGAMAQRAFGQYDLPLPRPESNEMLVVPANMSSFADDWSLAESDIRMWVLVHELSSKTVLQSEAVATGITDLVRRHVGAFRPDPNAILERLGSFDAGETDPLAQLEKTFSDPTVLLGAVRTKEQEEMAPLLDTRVTVVLALIDAIVDEVASRLFGNAATMAEAIRRRRLDTGADTIVLEKLLGLDLSREQLRRGADFVRGIRERVDGPLIPVLSQMITAPGNLPTPNELVAPGLWMARLGLD